MTSTANHSSLIFMGRRVCSIRTYVLAGLLLVPAFVFGAATLLSLVPAAHAGQPVDLALVLVTDVSRSIDDSEFQLEKGPHGREMPDALRQASPVRQAKSG